MHKSAALFFSVLVACGEGALPISAPMDGGGDDGMVNPVPQKPSRLHDLCLVGGQIPSEIFGDDGNRVMGVVECVMGKVTNHVSFERPTMQGTLEIVTVPPDYLLRYQYKYVRITSPLDTSLYSLIYSSTRKHNNSEVRLETLCSANQWCRLPGNAQYVRAENSPQPLTMVFVTLGEDEVASKYGVGHYFVGWSKEGQPCAGGAINYATGMDFPNACGL